MIALSILAAGLTLTGCEIANQDGGNADSRQGLNGLVVDGRVAGGKVWVDSNNNYKIDDFEPYAYTDSDGYYSYNPLTNTNYCSLPVISDEYQRYCLLYGSSTNSMIIRIKGGIDLSTGERLKGVMAMSSTISSSSELSTSPLVLSPITTLLSSATTDSAQANIRTALGITSDTDLRLDFSTASDDRSKRFLANSVAVQTMMDVLVSSADTGTSEETHFANVINSISLAVSTNIEPPATFNNARLSNLMSVVTTDISKQTSVASRLADLNTEINKISTALNLDAVNAQLKAAEVVSQLVKKEVKGNDVDAAKKILDAGIGTLNTSLLSGLNDDTVEFDIASITNTLVDAGKTAVTNNVAFDENEIAGAVNDAKLATGTTWGGQWFVLEATAGDSDDLEVGSYIAVRLDGTEESSGGRLAVCVNVSVADSTDPEESMVNEYIGGSWSKISAGAVVLNLDYEGQTFEGKMKAKVLEDTDTQQQFRFTTEIDGATEAGDLVLNANGVSALANVAKPTSSADCANNVDTVL